MRNAPMPKKIATRKSAIHGNGMFAVAPIAKGAPVFPVLVHSNGRAYQILPQRTFAEAP